MKPVVSIITPVKNAAPWLEDCLQSGLKQNLQDWEWIWVDDHSDDETAAILHHWVKKDHRIRVYRNNGRGILPALQLALQKAGGRFITRMDADDLMPQGRLLKMSQALEAAPPRHIITGEVRYFSQGKLSVGYQQYQQWLNQNLGSADPWQQIYRECVVASPNWMMRRSELSAINGFTALEYPEDYDLCFRWYQQGFRLANLAEITLHWREHPGRTSRHSDHYQQEAFFSLKIARFLELDYRGGSLCVWGRGSKARLVHGELAKHGKDALAMDLKADPSKGILDFRHTAQLKRPQVLLAIYPQPLIRKEIKNYLEGIDLLEGRDYWWL